MRVTSRIVALSLIAAALSGCGDRSAQPASTAEPSASALGRETVSMDMRVVTRPWTGDFDGMVERRRMRILVPFSRTLYMVDQGVPRGIAHDVAVMLEQTLNKRLKTTSANRMYVIVVPTPRDALYDSLVEGRGDIVLAGVTVTPERKKLVDFTVPTKSQVKEIVVTGPGAPPLATLDDLCGKKVTVRDASVQLESLQRLNQEFKKQGRPLIKIKVVPAQLADEEILEMVNAGLPKITVVNDFYAEFWRQILPDITLHPEIVLRDEGALAWAVRKGSPKLLAALNPIIETHREGTLFGNMLLRKYLKDTAIIRNASSDAEIRKFNELVSIFRKYGEKYDVDYLLMMAQGYQESRLDHSVRSKNGAIGVMQVMPATGRSLNVGDITQLDSNIEAGVKYMRRMVDEYFKDESMDRLNKALFAFAAYNAGPNRIQKLRKDAAARGLDPNVWFNNVERVAAEQIGRETVTYVSNIYKYYIAYTLVMQDQQEQSGAKIAGAAKR
jgi:membrane-bound lytic murein transglycosylase MltF